MTDVSSTTSTSTTASTANRKVWQKNAYDVDSQTTSTATDVGYLRQNDSRIDVVSTMDTGMKQQVFSFQNLTTAPTQLSYQVSSKGGSSQVRVQVLNQAGQVVADSKSGMGAASKAYTALTNGTYDLKQGKYYVVAQRASGVATNSQIAYNVQLKQGSTVRNDYITESVVEPAKIKQEQALAAVQQASPTLWSTNASNPFGTYASDPFGLGGYNIFGQKTTT